MTNPSPSASSTFGSIDPKPVDRTQALRTGLELARASQLTMLRLQLALHKANRRTAMQAVDNLLDIDAEMEGLASTLTRAPAQLADDAALSDFIGLQKAAIAVEKHGLTGGDWRSDAQPMAIMAPGNAVGDANLPTQPVLSSDDVMDDDRAGSRRWMHVLAVVIVVTLIGIGLTAYLWPSLPGAIVSLDVFG